MSTAQLLHREIQVETTFDLMTRLPKVRRARRLAEHYLSLVETARVLRRVTEETGPDGRLSDNASRIIDHLVGQIRDAHAHDLGHELRWPEDQRVNPAWDAVEKSGGPFWETGLTPVFVHAGGAS